jgi:drug/metabolite transporter (DMT)-like permease
VPERRSRRQQPNQDPKQNQGPGRVLVAVYAVFVLAAGSRAAVQISTKFSDAPTAYLLSALAAVVYVVATVSLARSGPRAHRVAVACLSFELAGVLVVGTYSLLDQAAFPDATVWSDYGMGYLFIPVVLPVIGLYYLRTRRGRAGT